MSRGFLRLRLMAIKTYTEQLESVQAAIASIEGGAQSHSINGRAMTKADIGTLYAREERLRPLADRERSSGRSRFRPVEF